MKIPAVDWLHAKYKFLSADAKKKGILRSLSENIYEFRNKNKFKQIGVYHPDFCLNLASTNSKSANKDSHENQPSSFYSLKKAFEHLDISHRDISMLDVGCGAGRVLSFGMFLKFKEVHGVDLDEPALEKARENCSRMQSLGYTTDFTIKSEDACAYIIPPSVNVVYLFNPFGKKTMENVAGNIMEHVSKSKEEVYVIYTNPSFQELFMMPNSEKIFESFYKTKKPDTSIFKITSRINK